MRNRVIALQIALVSAAMMFYCGCAPEADVAMTFAPDTSTTYRVLTEIRKDHKFDEPAKDKYTEQYRLSRTEMTCSQTVTEVDSAGNALADIEIQKLAYLTETQDGAELDFDSERDTGKALAKLVGQTYTIKVSPSGQVLDVLNIDEARKAVRGGKDGRIATHLLSDDTIKKLHSVLALPDTDKSQLSAGDTWSRIGSSAGALVPKSYEKVYTVKDISNVAGQTVATIEMEALPSSEQAEGVPEAEAGGLGFFSKMFEGTDDYSGRLVVALDTGQVRKYHETLVSTNTAAEFPKGEKTDKGPDVLTLVFTKKHSIEAVD